MGTLGRAKSERERLQAEIKQKREELRAAEMELRSVQSREPFVRRIATSLGERRFDNHLGRDFEITLTPERRHA